VGTSERLHQEVLPRREATLDRGRGVVQRRLRIDRRDPEDVDAGTAEGRTGVAGPGVVVEDLERLVDRPRERRAGERHPQDPTGEVITIERLIARGMGMLVWKSYRPAEFGTGWKRVTTNGLPVAGLVVK